MPILSTNGLDALMLSMKDLADLPDDVLDEMVNAGADVIVEAQRETARTMTAGPWSGSGGQHLADSITKGKAKKKGDGKVITVYPRGTRNRTYREAGRGKTYTESNSTIAFINEYGAHGTPARQFIRTANEKKASDAVAAEEAVFEKFLESKGF